MFHENWYKDNQLNMLVNSYAKVEKLKGNIIELGCWEGRSTVRLANKCYPEILIAVDNWKGNLAESDKHVTVEILKERNVFAIFKENIDELTKGNVGIVIMDCFQFLDTMKKCIKFCHIDASHDYESVKKALQIIIPNTVNKGIICGDDFKTAQGVQKAVMEMLPNFEHSGNFWWAEIIK